MRGSHGRQYGPCIYALISLMHLPMKQSLHTYQEYFSHRYSIKLLLLAPCRALLPCYSDRSMVFL